MALIKTVNNLTPHWGNHCYFAENATIIGDVIMGDECSVWFHAVIRGDVNSIRLGNRVNVQDGAVIHCTYKRTKTIIGDNVSIGHNAIVHGCTLESNTLIGMGAIVMDQAVVEENCLIAAGAVVLEGAVCQSGHIYGGIPARKLKPLDDATFQDMIERISRNYVKYAGWFRED